MTVTDAVQDVLTTSSLCHKLTPMCTLIRPDAIICKLHATHHTLIMYGQTTVQNVVCWLLIIPEGAILHRVSPCWCSGKVSASIAADLGPIPTFVMDLLPGRVIPVAKNLAAMAGPWSHRVSAGPDRPGVGIQKLGETESLICNFYLSVAAHTIIWADPSLRYVT